MERIVRHPKNGDTTKQYVTLRATGWHGVENALLTSTIQAAQFKEQNNLWRGQLKVLTDHNGAYFNSPIAVNGPQGESRHDALRKLEAHYKILGAWVKSKYGDGDEDVSAPPTFVAKYNAALNHTIDVEEKVVKRRKVEVEEELSISEQAMKLAIEALSRARAYAPPPPPAAPTSPVNITNLAIEALSRAPPAASTSPVNISWLPPPPPPPQSTTVVEAPKAAAEKPFVVADTIAELDARIAKRERQLYEPYADGEASSISSGEAFELFSLFS